MLRIRFIILALVAFLFEGCTCCAYLNHMFNAERLDEQAAEMRTARLDSIPEADNSRPGAEERKKYDKIIEKGSRVLERFPKNKKRSAEAVFLIGESFRHKLEWDKAITKYDEFERYFADHDSMPAVEYQRAYCLYKNHEYNISRFALEPVVASKDHPYYFQGLNLLSLLDEQAEFPDQAIASLEAVLADTAGTPFMRAKAHFRLAGLYFKKDDWEKAREHYTAEEIKLLNVRERQTAGEQAAECLANQKQYLPAADEYKELFKNPEFESKQPEFLVRIGELTMLGDKVADAMVILQKVNTDYPKTEHASRSYFCLGDYEQSRTMNYDRAVVYYDSSFLSRSISKYGQESRERRDALKRLIAMRSKNDEDKAKDSIPNMNSFFSSEFQIAELFLFKLDETDSAVARLDNIIQDSKDSARVLRALYAKAFIYDEFKHDPDSAEELYKEVIEKYPNTEYAKQAQVNLGMRVTLKTREDEAKERYLVAESLWTVASEIPLDQMDLVDSAYARAFEQFDSLYQAYPETQSGAQALYMKAMYFQMNPERMDSTQAVYKLLRSEYGQTPWGKQAAKMLNTRLTVTDEDIKRLRKRLKSSEEHINRLSAKYYEQLNKAPEEKQAEVKSKEDEILENTYNSMYDFE
ncbi:tetratricopeptide repeat protein [Fibrobacter sp. UWEL]|uniref:tetratricopeptide repeat protein n=1 Tax=Fibrobacter sp. UWEL TaxID=1896209 RepID=UPI00091DA081|nr:tetratricopeptide repeat protein [Fibrobacter sp. UWEL]SHK89689.1 Tetratricopeptide repeat-containing protein [Fibrobacter sp. UWEL]